jgi:hypothetical protein
MDQFDNSITMPKCLTFKPEFIYFWQIFTTLQQKKGHEYTKEIIVFSMTCSQIWRSPSCG